MPTPPPFPEPPPLRLDNPGAPHPAEGIGVIAAVLSVAGAVLAAFVGRGTAGGIGAIFVFLVPFVPALAAIVCGHTAAAWRGRRPLRRGRWIGFLSATVGYIVLAWITVGPFIFLAFYLQFSAW